VRHLIGEALLLLLLRHLQIPRLSLERLLHRRRSPEAKET
jgi:hypothetical protein